MSETNNDAASAQAESSAGSAGVHAKEAAEVAKAEYPPGGCLSLGLFFGALVLGALSLFPRGVRVCLHNSTDRSLGVCVVSGSDAAFIRDIPPGGEGSASVYPKHDSGIDLVFDNWTRDRIRALGIYTHSSLVGTVRVNLIENPTGVGAPFPVEVSQNTSYVPISLPPENRFARGAAGGLAIGLLLLSWSVACSGWRPRLRDR